METSVSEGTHGTARSSKPSRPMSTVAGLSMNKHGLSMNTLRSQRPQQVYVALPPPPLNLNNNTPPLRKHSLDSKTSGTHSTSSSFSSSSPLARSPNNDLGQQQKVQCDWHSSSQSLLFTTSTLSQAIRQCLRTSSCTDNVAFFTSLGHQLQQVHDQLESATTTTTNGTDSTILPPLMTLCISTLRDVCTQLHTRRDGLILDNKAFRHLLLAIHGTTLDLKEVCESIHRPPTATTTTTTRHRSHSDYHPPPQHGLYAHLKMAVSASSHLIEVLNQSRTSMLAERRPGLEDKFAMLDQPIQQAITSTHQLNEHLDRVPSHTIQFWEDTNLFLKVRRQCDDGLTDELLLSRPLYL